MASEEIAQTSSGRETFEKPQSEKFFANMYQSNFTSHLVSLRENGRLTDVTLKCQDVKLNCHRVVLAAASPFFHAMFCNEGFEESEQDVVELTTFDSDILPVIINYIYTGEATLSTENVQSICSACDQLELLELKEGCDTFMAQRVEPANCYGLKMFSKKFDLQNTLKECKECMQERLQEILHLAPDTELKILGEDELIECISSDEVEGEEDTVFKLVEKWILIDPDNRMKSVNKLLEHVRLALCSPIALSTEIKKSPIMQSTKCAQLVIDALSYQFVPATKQLLADGICKPRIGQKLLLLDSVCSDLGQCWYLDTKTEQWSEFTNLPVDDLEQFTACVCGEDIIITGGCEDEYQDIAWAFSLSTKEWKALPDMLYSHVFHGMVSIEDEVYVLGGGTDEAERLDAGRQGWSEIAPMVIGLDHHMVVNIGRRLYVMGGVDDSGISSRRTQVYDIATDHWDTKADMPQECDTGAAVVLNNKIYVVGDDTKCCLSYDPSCDTWMTHSRPQQARHMPAAAVWKGRIVLCGGAGRSDIEEYDAETDEWTTWQVTLPIAMSNHSILVARASFK